MEAAWQLTPEERRRRFDQAIEEGELFSILSLWADQGTDKQSNEYIAEMIRERIRDIVDDPEVAETLSPRDHAFGTKRPCLDTNYYATYNRPDVRLVDLRKTPIERITEHGVQTTDETVEVDALVYATGFDAMTGAIVAVDITGRDGVTLDGQVGVRPAHLPRADVGRVPQPVPDHRSGQPVGAVEHGRVDRAARRLGRRPPR